MSEKRHCLDESSEPNTAVGGNQVHQPELCQHLILVYVQFGMHEHVVHLHEGEHHLQDRVDCRQDAPPATEQDYRYFKLENCPAPAAVKRCLKKVDKLQPRVDERAEPEGDGPQPHHQSPVALVVLRGHHLDDHPRVEFLIFYIDTFRKLIPGFLAFLPSAHKIEKILLKICQDYTAFPLLEFQ